MAHTPTRLLPPDLERWFEQQEFAVGAELAQIRETPTVLIVAYGVFLIGVILMWPAILMLARLVAEKSPILAVSGGALVILGLFARFYYAGVDHAALVLTKSDSLEQATAHIVSNCSEISGGPFGIAIVLAAGSYLGMLLLAIGAYRAKVFGPIRAVLFLLSGIVFMGVLKQSDIVDLAASALGSATLVPLGIQLFRQLRKAPPAQQTAT